MARQRKLLSARKSAADESVLLRSAETLGRIIGSLQRQLDVAARRTPAAVDDATGPAAAPRGRKAAAPKRKATARAAAKGDRKNTRAAHTTAARKATGRKGSGARKKAARKSTRRG